MPAPAPITGPLSLGDLLDRAFRIYRARFGSLVLTAAIFLVPLGILSGILSGTMLTSFFALFAQLLRNPNATPDAAIANLVQTSRDTTVISYALTLVSLVANAIITLALTGQSIAILHNQPMTLAESLRAALRRFWAFVGMSLTKWLVILAITVGFLMIVGCAVFALTFAASGLFATTGPAFLEDADGAATIMGIVVLVCCLYLGIILLALLPTAYLTAR
ncbi:MAG: hypothetical protein M3Q45_11325, partial [Chloroflexota bacterium]|nr:hypothetical protein [Chloroflexota bacterium]